MSPSPPSAPRSPPSSSSQHAPTPHTHTNTHIINPHSTATHTHTIILLHGRGSHGEEFADELFECECAAAASTPASTTPPTPTPTLTLPQRFPTCKWIFPTAALRFSSTFQENMHEWFDIVSLADPSRRQDLQVEGLRESVMKIMELVRAESVRVPRGNVILGGISQGYATAVHVLLAMDVRLAGFVGLSGWMPFAREIQDAARDQCGDGRQSASASAATTRFVRANLNLSMGREDSSGRLIADQEQEQKQKDQEQEQKQKQDQDQDQEQKQGCDGWEGTRMFLAHELYDETVSCNLGEEAKVILAAAGANAIFWHTYDSGEHWLKEPEEIEDLVEFIDQCLQ